MTHPSGNLLGDPVIALQVRSHHLHIDRRGNSKIQNLRDDIRRLREELHSREMPRQIFTQAPGQICRRNVPTADLTRRLREDLPRHFPGVEFFFQPADIVTQILNFGIPAPIDVQVVGTDLQSNYGIAQQIAGRMRHIPGTADVHVQQLMSLPTLYMDIHRTRVNQVGLTAREVAQSALVSLSGSFQTAPNFWLNPHNEVTYQMAVQSPQYRMTDLQDLMNIPVISGQGPQLMGNLVQISPTVRPATVNHYNVQPIIDVYASTQDRDLGAVAADSQKILATFNDKLPRGTHIVVRGQVSTMRSSF